MGHFGNILPSQSLGIVLKKLYLTQQKHTYTTTPQPFYGPFTGTTRVSWWQKRTSGLYGARED